MASARASTSAVLTTGRSGAFSTAAPFTWQGFRAITSSVSAVRRTDERSR